MNNDLLLLFGKNVQIRNIDEKDKQAFRDMHYAHSALQIFFDDMILDAAWESQTADGVLTGAVTSRSGDAVYGFCQLRGLDTDEPEALVQIADEWSDKGFGSEAAALLADYALKSLGFSSILCETDRDDAKACHIAAKVGGTLVSTEPDIPQEIVDFGLAGGTLDAEDVSYTNTYRITK